MNSSSGDKKMSALCCSLMAHLNYDVCALLQRQRMNDGKMCFLLWVILPWWEIVLEKIYLFKFIKIMYSNKRPESHISKCCHTNPKIFHDLSKWQKSYTGNYKNK